MFFGYSTKVAKEPIEQLKPQCNLFGIGMERSKHFLPQTTHFVLPTSSNLTAPLMQALMAAAHLVTLDYVDQVLRLAKLDAEDANSLEKHFRLPDEEGYFPDGIEIEGMIKPQVARALAANERRKTMFVGTTFLFIHGDNGMSKVGAIVARRGRADTDDCLGRAWKRRCNCARQVGDEWWWRVLPGSKTTRWCSVCYVATCQKHSLSWQIAVKQLQKHLTRD